MNTKNKRSLKSKFFLSMLLISTFSIIVVLISTSFILFASLSKMGNNNAIAQLDYISSQLDYYLSSTKNYAKTIIIDETIQDNTTKYNASTLQFTGLDTTTMKNHINGIIQSTDFIYSVSIFSLNKDLIVSTDSIRGKNPLLPPDIDSDRWVSSTIKTKTSFNSTAQVLSYIQPFYSLKSGGKIGYLEISILEDTLYDIYEKNISEYNYIYMVGHDGTIKYKDNNPQKETTQYLSKLKNSSRNFFYEDGNMIFYKRNDALNWYIVNMVAIRAYISPIISALFFTLLITFLCIIVCLIAAHKLSFSITAPIYHLIFHTQKIKHGQWKTINEVPKDNDLKLLFDEFNNMILAQEELKNTLVEEQKQKSRISLNLLQQQVNPHFLYNTLDNICALAEIDEKEALLDIVMNLSTFYRVGLSNGKFQVTIQEELTLTEAYLHIMKIRYYNKFDYTITCPEELYNCSCIKLLLQPLVENSIYHGIKEISYTGFIHINIYQVAGCIQIVVEDNGKGFTNEEYKKLWEDKEHFGVKNIHQRIKLYFGEHYGLTMDHGRPNGCKTTITIPKREGTNYDV